VPVRFAHDPGIARFILARCVLFRVLANMKRDIRLGIWATLTAFASFGGPLGLFWKRDGGRLERQRRQWRLEQRRSGKRRREPRWRRRLDSPRHGRRRGLGRGGFERCGCERGRFGRRLRRRCDDERGLQWLSVPQRPWACTTIACGSTPCGGFVGGTCSANEYCAYMPGQLCGAADASAFLHAAPGRLH